VEAPQTIEEPKEKSGGLGFFGWYFILFLLALLLAAILAG